MLVARERSCIPMLVTNSSPQATNQLLTALDRLRSLPNILVCCTSNLVEAIVGDHFGPLPGFLRRSC
jgi:hypothetical protein